MGRMDLGLKDRVAAVAAATSGLGLAIASELLREGARVAICGRDPARLGRALEGLRASLAGSPDARQRVIGVAADLASPAGAETFLRQAAAELGPVDILVVNCGGPPAGGPLAFGDEAWRSGFELTFLSAARLVAPVVQGMRERHWGRIVFVTSISVKQPIAGLAMSTALRSAVVGYAKSLSDELAASGITVNCVAPGSTSTERLEYLFRKRAETRGVELGRIREEAEAQIPARRLGRPEELAAAVAFLASTRASFITGTILPVDGGAVRSLT
jgi:3-oxoacyl-[acyl-carrier protein] reductase